MGLAAWFETFCSDIQVKNATSISTRYKTITQRLNIDFWTTTSDGAHSLYAALQRVVLMFDGQVGTTQWLAVSDTLKAVVTGEKLPGDLPACAAGSSLLGAAAASPDPFIPEPG